MAKFDLRFIDCEFDHISIKCAKVESDNTILVSMLQGSSYTQIRLDKSTSIKFAKTLRTEINKITESENLIDGGSSFNTLEKGNFTTLTGTPKKGGNTNG